MGDFTLTTESESTETDGTEQPDHPSIDDGGLSENVAEDIIEYSRANIIANEQQAYLLLSGWLTGWLENEERYVNNVVIGSAAGGKTHTVRKMKQLLPAEEIYDISTTTEAGMYNNNEELNSKRCAIFSEWQKMDNEVQETIKEMAGDDGGSKRNKSVQEEGSTEWESDQQEVNSKPHSFTYAEFGMDDQAWSRLFKNYVDEGRVINEAVAKQHAGHKHISVEGDGVEYIYPNPTVESDLQQLFRSLPREGRTHMPEWVYYSYRDMLGLNRSQSKRSSAMIPNYAHSSCLQNFNNRQTTTIQGQTKYVVGPQDVANVLSTRETLLGTTHEIEPRKRALIQAVKVQTDLSDYCTIDDVQNYLEANSVEGVSRMKRSAIEDLLEELEENFIVRSNDQYTDDGVAYQFAGMNDVGYPRVSGFQQFEYQSDEPFLGVEDPTDPFVNCTDPFKDIPFKESVQQMRDEETQTLSVDSATGGGSGSSSDGTTDAMSASEDDPSQQTFGVSETPELDDPIAIAVHERLTEVADGEQFSLNGLTHEGVLSINTTDSEALAGTIADPEHDVWAYDDGSQKVHSIDEAKAKIEDAYAQLDSDDLLRWEAIDEDTAMCNVKDVEYAGEQ